MFLICYKKECNFFLWIDQPISHGIKGRLSYLPQPQVTRFHPYGRMKEMFEKHRQEAKQKEFIQHQRHTRKYDEGFELCDNGFNGNPTSFMSKKRKKTLATTQMLHFVQRKMMCSVRRITSTQERTGFTPKVTGCRRFCMKYTLKANMYLFKVMSSPPKNVIENNKQFPSYSRAFAQDAHRSKCIAILNNIRDPRSFLFVLNKNITSLPVWK